MQADAAAILALISELYSAAQQAQQRVQELEARLSELEAATDHPGNLRESAPAPLASVRGEE